MTDLPELPQGFTCACDTFHKYPGYVYAHWREVLPHTCDDCGAEHEIILGNARLTKKGGRK